jgi:hypothetical protein
LAAKAVLAMPGQRFGVLAAVERDEAAVVDVGERLLVLHATSTRASSTQLTT